jgi:hydroxyacylglutathione hydrolase
MDITPISAFSDNYIWMIRDSRSKQVFIVDPGDATPVLKQLNAQDLELKGILITHWHPDHTGGVKTLVDTFNVPVYGPDSPHIKEVTHPLYDGDRVRILGHDFSVIAVPGHTLDHIAYYCAEPGDDPVLFCGDTLFVGGCGRMFEGSPAQMLNSLQALAALARATRVYCAHEYTQANLKFAKAVEPDNQALMDLIQKVDKLRAQNKATVPSTIAQELATNPFLRTDQETVINSAREQNPAMNLSKEQVFATLRAWKDNF